MNFFSINEHFPSLNQMSMPNVEKYIQEKWLMKKVITENPKVNGAY